MHLPPVLTLLPLLLAPAGALRFDVSGADLDVSSLAARHVPASDASPLVVRSAVLGSVPGQMAKKLPPAGPKVPKQSPNVVPVAKRPLVPAARPARTKAPPATVKPVPAAAKPFPTPLGSSAPFQGGEEKPLALEAVDGTKVEGEKNAKAGQGEGKVPSKAIKGKGKGKKEAKTGQNGDKGGAKAAKGKEGKDAKEAQGVPLDPHRLNRHGGKQSDSREHTMYHIVSPDPNRSKGTKHSKTGQQSYNVKIGDGLPGNRYSTHNPDHSVVASHGQPAKNTKEGIQRPGKVEEKSWAELNHAGGQGATEWHKVTPKPAVKDGKNDKGNEAWTDKKLAENLVQQQRHFKNHRAGQKDSEYAKLVQDMLDNCTTEQCRKPKKLSRRAPVVGRESARRRALERAMALMAI